MREHTLRLGSMLLTQRVAAQPLTGLPPDGSAVAATTMGQSAHL